MKILMIAPTPFFAHRGTHIRILEEARALEGLGHNITVVTYHNGDNITDYIDTSIDVRRIHRWLFWYKKTEAGPDWQKIILNIFLTVKVFNIIRSKKPNIIHAHLHEGVLMGRFMQIIFFWRKLPLVSDFHGSLVGEMRSHGYLGIHSIGIIFRAIEKWINGMGDMTVVSAQENVLVIEKSRENKETIYLYDGVNISEYEKKIDIEKLKDKYSVPRDKFIVVYTGALIGNKGIDHIMEAIPNVVKNNSDIHFVIGGFPDANVRRFVKQKKIENSVTVISPLNYFELAEVNSLSDIAIDPKDAKVKQASGKILQYMAANLGIICADRATNHKYLSKNSAHFLEKVDLQSIQYAIEKFYNDREYLQTCAKNAKKDVERFDWRFIGKKLDNIYKKLV